MPIKSLQTIPHRVFQTIRSFRNISLLNDDPGSIVAKSAKIYNITDVLNKQTTTTDCVEIQSDIKTNTKKRNIQELKEQSTSKIIDNNYIKIKL